MPERFYIKKITKLALIAGMAAACFNTAACSPTPEPEPQDLANLGAVSQTVLFEGGPAVANVTVDAAQLQSGQHYVTRNAVVTVQGDIPANTTVGVIDGKLVVEGNVGDGAKVGAAMPRMMQRYDRGGKGVRTGVREVGLLYPHVADPAVVVTGSVGQDSVVIGNADVVAQCAPESATVASVYRSVNISVRAQIKC